MDTSTALIDAPSVSTRPDAEAAAELTLERLEARICQRSANLAAAEALWLLDVAEFDRREGWAPWETRSCAAWLSWHVGLDMRAAREKVRVAHALVAFPVIAASMLAGRLSYSKARAITRIANELNAAELVDTAIAATSNQLERYVNAYQRARRPDDQDPDERAQEIRGVHVHHHRDHTQITIRLPIEAAQCLLAAIDRFVANDPNATTVQRRADAVVDMAEHAIAHIDAPPGHDQPRYLATIHLGPDTFADDPPAPDASADDAADGAADDVATDAAHGAADDAATHAGSGTTAASGQAPGTDTVDDGAAPPTEAHPSAATTLRAAWDRQRDIACCVAPGHGGPTEAFAVPLATARRLLCDAAIEGIIFDRDGNPLELGRQLRFPNRRQRRALWLRDGGCRFPGCTHRGWLDAHHIIHWIDQGDTLLFNLVLLCRTHHRVVHEAGWQLVGNPGGDLTFVRPNGTRIDAAPPVFHGCADDVDDLGHTEADGRSRWEGDDLDLDYAISALLDNDDLRQRRRDAAEAASSTSTECS